MNELTPREREVFKLIGACLSTQEIAERLVITNKTVEAHKAHLQSKLLCKNSRELLALAVRESWGEERKRMVEALEKIANSKHYGNMTQAECAVMDLQRYAREGLGR